MITYTYNTCIHWDTLICHKATNGEAGRAVSFIFISNFITPGNRHIVNNPLIVKSQDYNDDYTYTNTLKYQNTHTYKHTHIHTNTHTHRHTHIYTYTHKDTHTYTPISTHPKTRSTTHLLIQKSTYPCTPPKTSPTN